MPDNSGTSNAGKARDDEISYVDAVAELEQILDELDGDDVDVDVLGARVQRAAELLRLCRDRISGARLQVEQVVAELEAEDETVPSAPQPGETGEDNDVG